MCYHRRLHFILCNHAYDLEIVRPCASALSRDSPPTPLVLSSSSPSRASGSAGTVAMVCRPMVHPWTTYKVRRLCEACLERRRRFDERVREVREELVGVRGWMGERGLLREGGSTEGMGDGEKERSEEDGEEERDEGDIEGGREEEEMEEDEIIDYIHPFVR
ncbi:hypothetical protein VE03_07299 [Pseudogymnoascus sp. 23342-1-I1]|nr:hypothetical protein VE03_07299 [Pseudogymnoascus sp. 23342-1-I1]